MQTKGRAHDEDAIERMLNDLSLIKKFEQWPLNFWLSLLTVFEPAHDTEVTKTMLNALFLIKISVGAITFLLTNVKNVIEIVWYNQFGIDLESKCAKWFMFSTCLTKV